jgi:transcriptional regulator with XRE-family HTH domain
MSIGSKIRSKREALGMTLRDLASQAGVTPGFVSLVERDQADPSITSLRKIASVLGVPMFHLLAEDSTDQLVVRANQRRHLEIPGACLDYEILSPPSASQLLFFKATLEPNACSSEELLSHPMEECTLVVRGKLKLELGADTYILEPGDSMCWDGNMPHRLSAIGDETLELVSCATPPLF